MGEIRKNLIYSTILTSAHYVFPLLVYPYVSRALGVSNIGLVGFLDSIATYFILFSMMGISIVGVREIARRNGDRKGLSEVFFSLLSLHAVTTAVALCVMVTATICVDELRLHWRMMGVGACKLVFNLFLVEWFYKGIEDFRYITLRSLFIRGAYVVSVFLFVRKAEDTELYYCLTMGVVAVTAVVNMAHAGKFVSYRKIKVALRSFIRPYFSFGIYELLATAYTTFNVAYLGFVSDNTEVGYYVTATKLVWILSSMLTAFTGVMLPRVSRLVAEGNLRQVREYLRKSIGLICLALIPVITAIEIFAPEAVGLLSGPGYEGAAAPLRVMMPFMLVAALEQLLVVQTLIPMGLDRRVTELTVLAAFVAVVLNIILVGTMGAVGSAVVWGVSESILLAGSLLLARNVMKNKRTI